MTNQLIRECDRPPDRGVPTVILHFGDADEHGYSITATATEDPPAITRPEAAAREQGPAAVRVVRRP